VIVTGNICLRKEEGMRSNIDDEYDRIRDSDDLIDPDFENEYEETQQEYGGGENRPRLTLVRPPTEIGLPSTEPNVETISPNDDPPGWPDF
jgi:hypothetical protein